MMSAVSNTDYRMLPNILDRYLTVIDLNNIKMKKNEASNICWLMEVPFCKRGFYSLISPLGNVDVCVMGNPLSSSRSSGRFRVKL